MVWLALISLYIALRDVKTHKISHTSLLALSIPLSLNMHRIFLWQSLLLILATLLVSLLFGIGGGDFKLLALLILTQGALVASITYLQILLMAISLSLLISIIVNRSLKGSIALAPAILLPFMACYLAI